MSASDFMRREWTIVKHLSCFAEIAVDINKYAALLDVVEAAAALSKSCDTGERNSDGTTRGVRMPDKDVVDALAAAINKLEGV